MKYTLQILDGNPWGVALIAILMVICFAGLIDRRRF